MLLKLKMLYSLPRLLMLEKGANCHYEISFVLSNRSIDSILPSCLGHGRECQCANHRKAGFKLATCFHGKMVQVYNSRQTMNRTFHEPAR